MSKKQRQRKDPERRHIDPQARWARVKNARKDFKYCLVYKPQVEEYEDLGWSLVPASDDGPRLVGRGSRPEASGLVEARGHVLMCMPAKDHAELQRVGEDGHTGYERWDRLEDQILDRRGTDLLRGLRDERYLQYENTTTPAQVVG